MPLFSFPARNVSADAFALEPVHPSREAAKVAAAIARLGSGDDSLVALRLRDNALLKGRVIRVDLDSFTISDLDSAAEHRVSYSYVARPEGFNVVTGI